MEHKDNVAQFSTAELRDLFRLDEESRCQTHELLGCECGGKGLMPSASSGTTTPTARDDGGSDEEPSERSETASEDEDEPNLPKLMKASEVDMEKQERDIRENSRTRRKQKDKMHQSLALYSHIDPSLLSAEAEDDEDLAAAVDDDVLVSLLKDECNRIGYIFKKSNGAEVEE
ncbi:DNA repair and recombination protein [Penicillium chermesinum]|nr:DNA repair and recombination protein [Penicillium chermesinum]